jgi:hypothetical protein
MATNIFSIYEFTVQLKLSILFIGKVKITPFNGSIFLLAPGNEGSVAATEDQSVSLGDSDYQENNHRVCSKRKRPCAEFPWLYTHDWSKGDPPRLRGKQQCVLCEKWFLPSRKAHLKSQHSITSTAAAAICNTSHSGVNDEEGAALPSTSILQLQQTIKKPLPPHVVRRFENTIVDYVIGGDIFLCAAGEERFKQLVMSLTNG